jgi:hypothetical protein
MISVSHLCHCIQRTPFVIFEHGVSTTTVKIAICFLVKQEVKFLRNLFRREIFALKIPRYLAPVIGYLHCE